MHSQPNTFTINIPSSHSRWLIVMFALSSLLFVLALTSPVAGQDLDSMPWIDQETGELSPVEIQQRGHALTRDRNLIPKQPVKKAAPAANWNTNWNWGFGSGFAAIGTVLIYIVCTIAGLMLVALIVWVLMNSRIEMGGDSPSNLQPDRSLEESIRHLPFEMDVKQGDFQQQAQAAYQAGDFRMALVFLFSHVLVTLDQAKLLRLKKGKTNRQYLRELSPNRPLMKYYGDVMVPFEQTFFGDYPITKKVFEDRWQGLGEFQNAVDAARANSNRSTSASPSVAGTIIAEGIGTNV